LIELKVEVGALRVGSRKRYVMRAFSVRNRKLWDETIRAFRTAKRSLKVRPQQRISTPKSALVPCNTRTTPKNDKQRER
jgi:hypothetical protein